MVHLHRSAIRTQLTQLATGIGNFLLPPRCLLCRTLVTSSSGLCPECWARQRFIRPPLCDRCGLPFAFTDPLTPPNTQICAACISQPPPFSHARAALVYDDASRPLVLGFKHGDQTHMTETLATWMAQAGAPLLAECDLLLPVPLHPQRLFQRRFNQAALLANAIARRHQLAVNHLVLKRLRATPSQGHQRRAERYRNVRGAFGLTAAGHALIKDRNVLVIDDVHTTGATLSTIAVALNQAGAAEVSALTLARAVQS